MEKLVFIFHHELRSSRFGWEHTIIFEKFGLLCSEKCGRPHLKNSPCPHNIRTVYKPPSPWLRTSFMDGP